MFLLVVLLSGGAGCGRDTRMDRLVGPADGSGSGTDGFETPGPIKWPYWPRRMRIHPLTQFATDRDTGQLVIEVRVEFFDERGHTCKGVGQVLMDLHAAGRGRHSEPLETWALDLLDATVNYDHYDELTRTYVFRLNFDPRILPERPELWAYFHSADGRRFQAQDVFQLRR